MAMEPVQVGEYPPSPHPHYQSDTLCSVLSLLGDGKLVLSLSGAGIFPQVGLGPCCPSLPVRRIRIRLNMATWILFFLNYLCGTWCSNMNAQNRLILNEFVKHVMQIWIHRINLILGEKHANFLGIWCVRHYGLLTLQHGYGQLCCVLGIVSFSNYENNQL